MGHTGNRILLKFDKHMLTIILCTAPDKMVAEFLARGAVKERLAACVTILPTGDSVYLWQGKIELQKEVQLLIKTSKQKQQQLCKYLKTHHPYRVPELLAIDADVLCPEYDSWVKRCLE